MSDSILDDAGKKLFALRDELINAEDGETRYHFVGYIAAEHKGRRHKTAVIRADDDVCWEISNHLQRIVYEGGHCMTSKYFAVDIARGPDKFRYIFTRFKDIVLVAATVERINAHDGFIVAHCKVKLSVDGLGGYRELDEISCKDFISLRKAIETLKRDSLRKEIKHAQAR